ncbi:MAG: hypothetical protein ASARMPRED_008257 [Alectoria sarmentosa]|nr:MAG: hypothetical protein ASARMPRED_008257 [Alectoria sarmentosa]
MHLTLAILAFLAHASLLSATDVCPQQAKSDPTPNCNAIHLPGLHDIVPGGTPYTIRWGVSAFNNTGTFVSLVLCQGDSLAIKEIDCIVDHTPNTGSFVWTPATDLVPDGNHNYGLKIIANTGDFQWSDQFGISNPVSTSSPSSPAAAPTASTIAVKESAKAVKQASDGQIQEPTGTVEVKEHHTLNISNAVSHALKTEEHTAKPFATGTHLSAHLVHHDKGANATHVLEHQKPHVSPSVIAASVTESATPTVAPTVPTTLPPTTVASSTSAKTSSSAGAAARAAASGVMLIIGAVAALVL